MFALAIWDNQEEKCFLARDPLGVKPLYYVQRGNTLAFASEVRALARSGLFEVRVSRRATELYLLHGSVPEPDTILEGVRCLSAGHYMTWQNGQSAPSCYWKIEFDGAATAEEAAWRTREPLLESVRRHFVSDVPVSVFLSGGIDSTVLVALAQQLGVPDLGTFCVSFEDPSFDEGAAAARTARYFGTRHVDWRMDATTAKGLLSPFLAAADQPSIDGFNTYCVSRLAHVQGAKVVLSGLGGDELFGGYPSFRRVPQLMSAGRQCQQMPGLRGLLAGGLRHLGRSTRSQRLASYLEGAPSVGRAYWCVRGIFSSEDATRIADRYAGSNGPMENLLDDAMPESQPTVLDEISHLELTQYMRNQLLRDSDVMSMAWGLELRVPFVDRALVDALEGIPAKRRLAPGKRLLLDAVPEIPPWIVGQPKRGFSFPFQRWIQEEWGGVFNRIERESPVPLKTWAQRWSLLALENFLDRNGIGVP